MKAAIPKDSAGPTSSPARRFFQAKPEHGAYHINNLAAKRPTFFRGPTVGTGGAVPSLQTKCAEHEVETREGQGEQDGTEFAEVQRTPAFENGDDAQESSVQGKPVLENEKQLVQMKPNGEGDATSSGNPFFPASGDDGSYSETAKPFFTPVQAKLTVGEPSDRYEREADQMADRVVRRCEQPNESAPSAQRETVPALQARSDVCAQDEALQHRVFTQASGASSNDAESQTPAVFRKSMGQRPTLGDDLNGQLASNKGHGVAVPANTRGEMESAFQADFSGVRIHTDSEAVRMSQRLRAQAFTHGNDIYFNQGKFNPASREGKHLVAHELTHTLQQGASVNKKASRKVPQADTAEQETPEVQTNLLDDALSFGGNVVSGVAQGARRVGGAVVDAAGNVISAGQQGLSAVGEGLSNLASRGANFLTGIVEHFAPGLTSLLNGGLVEGIKQRIVGGVRGVVGGVLERVRSGELTAQLREILMTVRTRVVTTVAELAGGDCSALFQVFQALRDFAGLLFSPVLNQARELLAQGGAFILNLWNQFGAPAFEAIQAFAGSAWQWLQEKASWIWERTAPIRSRFIEAWEWIKTQLGIARDSAAGILDTLRQAAINVWDSIKGELTPFLGPLSTVATVLVLLSPLGPLVLIYKGAPALWNALKWIWQHLTVWQFFLDAKEMIVNVIIPALRSGFSWLSGALTAANQWLGEQFSALSAAFNGVLDTLRALPLFRAISGIFAAIKQQFDGLIDSIREALAPILTAIDTMITNLWRCLRPIVEFLGGLILLLSNPSIWPAFAAGLVARLAWALLPEGFKRAAIVVLLNFAIRVVRAMDRNMVEAPNVGSLWPIVVAGMVSFLERARTLGPDVIMQAIEKTLNLAIDPRTYAGLFLGVLKGIVWDGLVGLIRLVYDLIVGIPQALIALYQFIRNLIPDAEMVHRLLARGREIVEQVQAFIQRPDAVQELIEFIRQSPSILFSMVDTAMREARGWAQRTGEQVANTLFSSITVADPFNVGFRVGTVVGILLFEVLLLLGTSGGGTLLKWGGKAVQWLLKGIRWIGRGLARGGSLVRQALGMLRRVADAGWAAARRVGGALRGVLHSLKRYVDDVIDWIRRALQHIGRGARDIARDQLLWQQFRLAVRLAMQPINRGYEGVTRSQARARFRPILNRFRRVAAAPLSRLVVSGENRGYWALRARRRSGLTMLFTRDVGEVLMRRRHRWDLGREAVRGRLRREVSDRDLNTRGLQRIIDPLKDPYRFRRLEVVWDEPENDWNIMGAMSPAASIARVGPASTQRVRQAMGGQMLQKNNTSGQIAEVDDVEGLHFGTRSDPIPIDFYKSPSDYPTTIRLEVRGQERSVPMVTRDPVVVHDTYSGRFQSFRIGVHPSNLVSLFTTLYRRTRPRDPTATARMWWILFRLRYPNTNLGPQQMDHVTDLAFWGSNNENNLWPLDATINGRPFNDNWLRTYRVEYKKTETEMDTDSISNLTGKYFRVIGFNYQNPMPLGGRRP